ncbi:MAG TPA: GNAT family N-acetyltransferase [Alphaproteobacteria bacterium]|nr:GNAT family N-acetyltransferase [Alphaproteobacteria bacterium]
MTNDIRELDREAAAAHLPALIDLLADAVASGASVGFLAPLDPGEAEAYWRGVLARLGDDLVLLAAFDGGRPVGSVQLELVGKANGRHRAEIAKLLVHRDARRRGLGAALMAAAVEAARARGRSLLVLDTRTGDAAERLYLRLGWTKAGTIPNFARSSDGPLAATSLFYLELA